MLAFPSELGVVRQADGFLRVFASQNASSVWTVAQTATGWGPPEIIAFSQHTLGGRLVAMVDVHGNVLVAGRYADQHGLGQSTCTARELKDAWRYGFGEAKKQPWVTTWCIGGIAMDGATDYVHNSPILFGTKDGKLAMLGSDPQGFSSTWSIVGDPCNDVRVIKDLHQRIHVFCTDTANPRMLKHKWLEAAWPIQWSATETFEPLPHGLFGLSKIESFALVMDQDGRFDIFAAQDGVIYQQWQGWNGAPGGNWSGWWKVDAPIGTRALSGLQAIRNADGRAELFALYQGALGTWVVSKAQTAPNSGWGLWSFLNRARDYDIGPNLSEPSRRFVVGQNFDGRLQTFVPLVPPQNQYGFSGIETRWQRQIGVW
jgi:hypothetical protein